MSRFRIPASQLYYAASVLVFLLLPAICAAAGDGNLPPQKPFARFWINLILLNLLAAFVWMVRGLRRGGTVTRAGWVLFGLTALALCTLPPIFSGDLHEYVMRGRILGVYHQNPYLVPQEFPDDPFYKLTVWVALHKLPENYGPVWALIQGIAPTLFKHSYFWSIFGFKAVLLAFWAGSVLCFDRIARTVAPGKAAWMTPFFALNPIVVDHFWLDGHNDIVMVFWMLAAVWALIRGRWAAASALTALAVMIKFTIAVIAPAALIYYVRKHRPSPAALFRMIAVGGAICAGLIAAFYALFWTGWGTVSYFSKFGDWFATNSVPYGVHAALNRIGLPVSEAAVKTGFKAFFALSFLAALTWLVRRTDPGASTEKGLATPCLERRWSAACAWTLVAMYLSYTIPFYGHHLIWALPFLILAELPSPLLWSTLYSVTGLFFYFKRPSALFVAGIGIYAAFVLYRTLTGPKGPRTAGGSVPA